jgi:predicted nucleotidyltransferase
MTIKGGVNTVDNNVELYISVKGGKSYKRVYNDVVSVAINKFVIIGTTLSKILITKTSPTDVKFYISQIQQLLERAHVEFISGDRPFQQKYNMWLLDGYIRMLLETTDMKLIAQLLHLDSILYSIEEASIKDGSPVFIDFEVPKSISIVDAIDIDSETELHTPVTDDLSAYLHSLNNNLMILTSVIISNKKALVEIHKHIVKEATKFLQ